MIGKIARIEDDSYDGKDFKKVTLADGTPLKVKQGKEGALKAKWGELEVGKTYDWAMGSYQNKPFVQDFKVIAEASPPAPGQPPSSQPVKSDMSKEDWTEKQQAERFSIESQTAFKGIIELVSRCFEMSIEVKEMGKLNGAYDAALDWAMARLNPTPSPTTKPPSAVTTAMREPSKPKTDTKVNPDALFKNIGEFLTEAHIRYPLMAKDEIYKMVPELKLDASPEQLTECMVLLIRRKSNEEKPTEKKDTTKGEVDSAWDNL